MSAQIGVAKGNHDFVGHVLTSSPKKSSKPSPIPSSASLVVRKLMCDVACEREGASHRPVTREVGYVCARTSGNVPLTASSSSNSFLVFASMTGGQRSLRSASLPRYGIVRIHCFIYYTCPEVAGHRPVFYSRTSEETRNDFGIDYILIELSISHFTCQFISNVFYE